MVGGETCHLQQAGHLPEFRDAIPEARSRHMEIPQVDSIAPPTPAEVGDMEPSPMEAQGANDTISLFPGCQPEDKTEDRQTPPVDSTTSLAKADTSDTQPGPAETPPGDDTTVPLAEADAKTPKDLATAWAASPDKAESQVALTTGLVDKLASPPTPSGHAVEERQCVLTVTASMEMLNWEAIGVTSRGMVTASVGRVALRNPCLAATLLGPSKESKVVGHQNATIEELAEKDLAEGCP